jgi:hypothetical protein
VDTNATGVRLCQECQLPLPADSDPRRKCHAGECALRRQQKQLDAHHDARKVKDMNVKGVCEICQGEFTKTHGNHKYCKEECAAKGLARKVEEQKQRRIAKKL